MHPDIIQQEVENINCENFQKVFKIASKQDSTN